MENRPLPTPETPSGREEILRLCETAKCRDAGYEEMFARLADDESDPLLQAHARVVCGAHAYTRFLYREAADHFRGALSVLWGTGTRSERSACVNLAQTCMRQGRIFETLVLGRRAVELMRACDDAVGEFLAHVTLASVYAQVGDGPRRDAALDGASAVVGLMPDPPRSTCEGTLAHQRASQALDDGDARAAAEHVDALERTAPRRDPRFVPYARARVLLHQGRSEEALAILERLRVDGGPDLAGTFHVSLLSLEPLLALGRRGEAEERAREMLDGLGVKGLEPLGSGTVLHLAEDLGRVAQAHALDPDLARAAFDLAGTAALQRIAELDRFRAALPGLHGEDEEERAILAEYRDRFASEHRDLLRAIAGLFRGREGFPRTWVEDVIHLCAWCRRMRAPEGLWVEVEGLTLPEGSFFVSHGICPGCAANLRKSGT